jgi:GT2 family glycosyltransferase
MKKEPFISIILLNYNGKEFIAKCLQSIFNSSYKNYEVIIVDNCSSDNSLSIINEFFSEEKKLRIVALKKNFGYSVGNNIGYTYVVPEAKYVVFLNNDVVVDDGWLSELVVAMEADNNIGAAMPSILNLESPYENNVSGFMDVFMDNVPSPQSNASIIEKCFFASGCSAIIRRDVLKVIGLFNPNFFAYFEDTDLSWRIWLNGYSVVHVSRARVLHKGGASSSKAPKLLMYFEISKNRLYTFLLNFSLRNIVKYINGIILSYTVTMGINILLYLIRKNQKYLLASMGITKGFFYILIKFKKIWKERMYVQYFLRKVQDEYFVGKYILIPKPFLPSYFFFVLRRIGLMREQIIDLE